MMVSVTNSKLLIGYFMGCCACVRLRSEEARSDHKFGINTYMARDHIEIQYVIRRKIII